MSAQALTADATAAPSIADYELLRVIGRGAYGVVWLARNLAGSFSAIKIVSRAAFDHDRPFEREFEGIKRFEPISRGDPGAVAILHVGRGDGFFYYVMELADDANAECGIRNAESALTRPSATLSHPMGEGRGEGIPHSALRTPNSYVPLTLKRLLNDHGALPADQCLAIALSLTRALAHLHGHGLVHRDVKPSNVIFVNGVAKLADIGLVTSVDATRSFVGTEGYLPPEGAGTPQADLYSLGKVLYEMSTGCDRKEFPKLPSDIATRPDREALAELNAIIVRACQLSPRERYASATAMQAELGLLQAGRSLRRRRAWQQRLNHVKKLAVLVGALALVAAAAYLITRRNAPPEPVWSANDQANEALRDGIRAYHQNTIETTLQAITNFEHAIALDPGFGRAYALLARVNISRGYRNTNVLAEARPLVEKALALDPKSDEAHRAMAVLKSLLPPFDWPGAEKEYKTAIRLNRSPENLSEYAYFLANRGKTNEAVRLMEQALRLDLRSNDLLQGAAFVFEAARQPDQVIKKINELMAKERLPAGQAMFCNRFLMRAYLAKSNYWMAIEFEEKSELLSGKKPKEEVKAKYVRLRKAYGESGELGYWQQQLEFELAGENRPVVLAMMYARLGQNRKAIEYLQRTPETELVFELNRNSCFDILRSDPGFIKVQNSLSGRK